MRRKSLTALGLAAVLAIAACAEANDATQTTPAGGNGTTANDESATATNIDPSASVAALQQQMDEIADQVRSSQAAAELESNWEELQTELAIALDSVREDGVLDTTAVESRIQQFEDDLEALGGQVEPELRAAWDALRADLDQMTG